jgi:hypothetical protein
MDANNGTSGSATRIFHMDETEHERLTHRLTDLKRLLQQTTDPAAATVIGDDIADIETRLRASQSSLELSRNNSATSSE